MFGPAAPNAIIRCLLYYSEWRWDLQEKDSKYSWAFSAEKFLSLFIFINVKKPLVNWKNLLYTVPIQGF